MKNQVLHPSTHNANGTLMSYVSGFILSIILTLWAYFLVIDKLLSHRMIIISVIVLALEQFFIQMFFFLHLGKGKDARWNILVLTFMISIVCILVFGSLWIMNNLNYHMSTTQVNTYLKAQDGV